MTSFLTELSPDETQLTAMVSPAETHPAHVIPTHQPRQLTSFPERVPLWSTPRTQGPPRGVGMRLNGHARGKQLSQDSQPVL